jgi:O-antigen/teichoic acid export membrane protein
MIRAIYQRHKEYTHNFFWRAVQVLLKNGSTFLIFYFGSLALSPIDFGKYAYVMAIILFLTLLSDFGISTSTSIFVARFDAAQDQRLKQIFYNITLLLSFCFLILFVLISIFNIFFANENSRYLFLASPLLFLIPFSSMIDGFLRGLKQFRRLAFISFFAFLISFFPILFLIFNFSITGLFISQVFFYLILCILSIIFYNSGFEIIYNYELLKEILKYSLLYGIAVLGNYFFSRFDVILLGYFGFFKVISTYEIINKIMMILVIPFSIIGQIIGPNFSRWVAIREYEKIFNKMKFYTIFFAFTSVFFSILFYFSLPLLVSVFFREYMSSIFYILLPFNTIIFFCNIFAAPLDSGIVIPIGFAKNMAIIYAILSILNIILALLLFYLIGFVGIIFATVICSVCMVIALRVTSYYSLKKLF